MKQLLILGWIIFSISWQVSAQDNNKRELKNFKKELHKKEGKRQQIVFSPATDNLQVQKRKILLQQRQQPKQQLNINQKGTLKPNLKKENK